MQFPGIMEFLKKYQAKAPSRGHRPARLVSAALRLRQHAGPRRRRSRAPKTLDQDKLADYIRSHPFNTDRRRDQLRQGRRMVEAAGPGGAVPEHHRHRLEQFKDTKTEADLSPAEYRTGEVVAPYSEIKRQ